MLPWPPVVEAGQSSIPGRNGAVTPILIARSIIVLLSGSGGHLLFCSTVKLIYKHTSLVGGEETLALSLDRS